MAPSPYIRMILECEAAIVRIRIAVRTGNADAPAVADDFAFILRAVEPKLIGFARRVADLGPEAFEEALVALKDRLVDDILSPGYTTLESQFGAYLNTRPFRVLQELARKYGRVGVSSPVARLDQPAGEEGAPLGEMVADPQASVLLEAFAEREALQDAISALPPDERLVIIRRLADVDNNAIARELGASPATATRIYQRALASLRRTLSAEEEDNA